MIFTCTSQVSITSNNDTLICLPSKVAKEVIIDLEKGKSFEQENQVLKSNITLLETSIQYKDTLISSYQEKEFIYKDQINSYQRVSGLYIKQLQEKEEEITRHKREKKLGLGGAALIIIAILLL